MAVASLAAKNTIPNTSPGERFPPTLLRETSVEIYVLKYVSAFVADYRKNPIVHLRI
jgi:hypothetical protein